MQVLHYRFIARAVAALALLLASPAFAQAERWWRVELLIFSHEAVQPTEQWEAIPNLAYPSPAHFLSAAERGKGTSARQLPTPFITLPSAQLEFRGKAAYMQRSGKYRTLFHKTWIQPVVDKAHALPIILDNSGDTGQWPRLQGSIKLYLARYLHLETNLWLNTPGDYLSGTWQMPPPPLGPSSRVIEVPLKLEPEPELDTLSDDWASNLKQPEPFPEGTQGLLPPEENAGPVYPYRHAVLLKQERRMRSKEVHYIDHPLLGVVAKLTPLTASDLEAIARAEAGGAG